MSKILVRVQLHLDIFMLETLFYGTKTYLIDIRLLPKLSTLLEKNCHQLREERSITQPHTARFDASCGFQGIDTILSSSCMHKACKNQT